MLDASRAPSAPPAPIRVCSSSTKRMMFPSEMTSSTTLLILSSNSPLYLEPATMPDRSRVSRRLSLMEAGTLPETMRLASPSTIAVLPTPGSPIRQGLFLVLLLRICTTRRISSSLPMTGSSFPSKAIWVRSLLYCSRAPRCSPWAPACCRSSLWAAVSSPIAARSSKYILETLVPIASRILAATLSFSRMMASRMCSVPTLSERYLSAWEAAIRSTFWHLGEYPSWSRSARLPGWMLSWEIISSSLSRVTPFSARIFDATPSGSWARPRIRCSVPI